MQRVGIGEFDYLGFSKAVNAVRTARGDSWRDVARATSVSPSTLTRLSKGSHPDLETAAALASWARLDLGDFMDATDDYFERAAAYLHRDPSLSTDEAAALSNLLRSAYDTFTSGKDDQ